MQEEYIDTGKLRLVKVDLPLSIHKDAFRAALATHCAEDQGKFWEMHDRLFQNQRAIEPLNGHAEALGLDVATFEACMSSEKYGDHVRKDMALAQSAGATGTPSFVLGTTDPDDPTKVKGIAFIRGAQQFAAFQAEIDKALAELEDETQLGKENARGRQRNAAVQPAWGTGCTTKEGGQLRSGRWCRWDIGTLRRGSKPRRRGGRQRGS